MTTSAHDRFKYPREVGLLLDGEFIGRGARSCREIRNPANNLVLGLLTVADTNDLDIAIDAAARALPVWSGKSAWERDSVLRAAARLLCERKEYIASLLSLEQGKTLNEARGELDRTIETIEWCAEEAKRTYGRLLPPRERLMVQTTYKRPIGVVASFTPWNFPVFLTARKLAAALAAGCTVVAKPAEETPASCLELARVFVDAGLPRGALNIVYGVPADVSAHLIDSDIIRKISFTGSVPVGRLLSEQAGRRLKPVTMELGGHSPVVIFDDVNVEKVAAMCATFKFRNAGQVCIAPSRFLVQEGVYRQFVDRFTAIASAIRVGAADDPMSQMGPLNNTRRLNAAERFVDDAQRLGAKIVFGGSRIGSEGNFFKPTVITDVNDRSAILAEEPFCPIAPVVSFNTLDEALNQANKVSYGLAAYAFTNSIRNAAEIAEGFEAGWIGVNSFTPALPDAPLGGIKDSGLGYEGGPEGLDAYLQTKFLSQQVLT